MASGIESRWSTAKQPLPAASTRGRSPGSRTAATVAADWATPYATLSSGDVVHEYGRRTSTWIQPRAPRNRAERNHIRGEQIQPDTRSARVPRAPTGYIAGPVSHA